MACACWAACSLGGMKVALCSSAWQRVWVCWGRVLYIKMGLDALVTRSQRNPHTLQGLFACGRGCMQPPAKGAGCVGSSGGILLHVVVSCCVVAATRQLEQV